MKAFQRLFLSGGVTDLLAQNGGIGIHKGTLGKGACRQTGGLIAGGIGQNGLDVPGLQAAILGKEFETVAVEGEVAGGDHDGAVIGVAFRHRGHEHGRSAGHAKICHADALVDQGAAEPGAKSFTGETGISAHGHPEAFFLACLLYKPQGKASPDVSTDLFGQIDMLAFNALQSNAANIAAVLQFAVIHHRSSLKSC